MYFGLVSSAEPDSVLESVRGLFAREEPDRVLKEPIRGLFAREPRNEIFGVCGVVIVAENLAALGIGR